MDFLQKNKFIKIFFLCLLAAVGMFFLDIGRTSFAQSDSTVSGEQSNSYIYPSTVEAGGSATARLYISNALEEVFSVGIKVESPSGKNSVQIERMAKEQDYWTGYLPIPAEAEIGTWKVSKITITYITGIIKDYFPGSFFEVVKAGSLNAPVCSAFEYSEWSSCEDEVQERTVVSSSPFGCQGGYPILLQKCLADNCAEDIWSCKEWGECLNGYQMRSCEKILECANVESLVPALKQSCSQTEYVYCQYVFSDYGKCENGKQYRKIISRLPEGCVEKLTDPLVRNCQEAANECVYTYTDWSSCLNGKKTRSVVSVSSECLSGNPVLEEKCDEVRNCDASDWRCGEWSSCDSSTKQYRNCSLQSNCIVVAGTKPELARECLQASNAAKEESFQLQNIQKQDNMEDVKQACLKLGWKEEECALYSYKNKIIKECLSEGFDNQATCRLHFLEKYGKPLICQGMSEEACANLINKIILPELEELMEKEERENLSDYTGKKAVIFPENKTIFVDEEKEAGAIKKIKISSSPLSALNGSVSVILSKASVGDNNILSPVAIVFDENKNGIPDDIEKRIEGLSNENSVLTQENIDSLIGIDKALALGKPLEQPKLNANIFESKALTISSIETVEKETNGRNALKFQGKAEPNQVVALFVYSVMPIVLTVKADDYGNWVYELDKSLVDGKHEIYAVVSNSEGGIIEASLPAPFFIQEAKAVTMEDFIALQEASTVSDSAGKLINFYLAGGFIFILFLISGFLLLRKKLV